MVNLEDLTSAELDTYNLLLENLKSKQLEVKDVRKAMTSMKTAVALEISRTPYEEKDKIIKLQARIENLIALEAIFESPELAEKALETALKNLEKKTTK